MALTSTFIDCATVLERCTLVGMINRLHRSSKSASVTSPARVGLLTCGFTLVMLALVPPNTANAWDCPGVTEAQIEICEREGRQTPTPTPSSGGSGDGFSLSGFVSDHAGWIMLIAAGIAIWITIAAVRESAEEKEQKRAAEAARGKRIAEQHHAEQRALAAQAALAQQMDPSVYDPMNMGVAAPTPNVDPVPAPPTDPADLKRYATFGAVVPWVEGTAFAAVVGRDGSLAKANRAFAEALVAAKLGSFDEAGTFGPDASLTNVRTLPNDADAVELVVATTSLHIREEQLNKMRPYLAAAAHVETASPFVREAATGRYVTTLRNRAEQQAPAPEAAPVNDPSQWEW